MNGSRALVAAWLLFIGTSFSTLAQAPVKVKLRPEVEQFIAHMQRKHQFDEEALRQMFSQLQTHEGVVKAINAPSTSKPWHEFKTIFVTPTRTSAGVTFWNENAELLKRARDVYGVPEEIVVAIIGVETIYGKRTGSFRVIDALYTLGFDVPRRADYFRAELEQFLLLARDNSLDALEVKGSFAGAMGLPQFMPTSYRSFAVDFDSDQRINLWDNLADVIGSVANYLHHFGWVAGQPIVLPARVNGARHQEILDLGFKPHMPLGKMMSNGIESTLPVPEELPASLFVLEGEQGQEYWLALNNFYVITRYNHSKNYAMAVFQLAEAIARERGSVSAAQVANP